MRDIYDIIPKKYRDKIEEAYKDCDGYWAYAKEGYVFAETECGTAHGETQAQFLSDIRSMKTKTELDHILTVRMKNIMGGVR